MKIFHSFALAVALCAFLSGAYLPNFNDSVRQIAAPSVQVDSCGCAGDSPFGSEVLVLPDSLLGFQAIEDALDQAQITIPDSLFTISTTVFSCNGRIPVDLPSLRTLFGESLANECIQDYKLIDIGIYSYVWAGDNIFGKHWEYLSCNNIYCAAGEVESHILQLTLQDSCGNISSGLIFFEVKDQTPPVAKCKDYLEVELLPDPRTFEGGLGLLTVDDINDGSWDNCSTASVKIRRGLYYPDIRELWSAITQDSLDEEASFTPWGDSVYFFCADSFDGITGVELLITDEMGNADTCTTYVHLIWEYTCPVNERTSSIIGSVKTEMGTALLGVNVEMSGCQNKVYSSNSQGSFYFEPVLTGCDYTITPSKDKDHLNGLTTFDLILIQKHILGQTLLDSPYKMIAADVNNSGTITVFDLIQLQRLILNIDNKLSNNTSWRFVDATYEFPNPENPWQVPFPESIYIENIRPWQHDASFIAIKIGDVNGSATVENR